MKIKINKEHFDTIVTSINLVKKIIVEKDVFLKPVLDLKYSSKVDFINGTIDVPNTIPKEILDEADTVEFSYIKSDGYSFFEVKNFLLTLNEE